MSEGLTLEMRRLLVEAAIDRVSAAHAAWVTSNADPAITLKECAEKLQRLQSAEREFAWQWSNVKALLEANNGI
jgi:hypothetical protein